jgi:hypothetical protein
MLPFFLAGAGGDPEAATAAILELVSNYGPETGAELDLVVQIINFGAAVMDNLRQSTRPGLSDNAIFKYRAGAIALERAASRCRKTLAAMQAKRPHFHDAVPDTTTRSTPAPVAIRPDAARPAEPTSQPPAQPAQAAAPAAQMPAQPAPAPDNDQIEATIETMRCNALRLIASLQAEDETASLEPSGTPRPAVAEVRPTERAA